MILLFLLGNEALPERGLLLKDKKHLEKDFFAGQGKVRDFCGFGRDLKSWGV